MGISADNLKYGFIHPLSHLSTSNRELSPREQRDFLYRQEMAMEKILRTQEGSQDVLMGIAEIKKAEIFGILAANREHVQGNRQLLESINYELQGLDGGIRNLGNELSSIGHKIGISYKMTHDGFTNVLHGLGIMNNTIGHGLWVVDSSVNKLVDEIQMLSGINSRVLASLGEIDHKLGNPKKTAGLELKRDAFQFYQNGWYDESLRALKDSLEYLYTDYDNYYLQGIIYLEEKKDYPRARGAFEKATHYSKPSNQKMYAASLYKLATVHFIEGDFRQAFSCQLEGVKNSNLPIYWLNLARCSVCVNDRAVFEDAAYKALIGDKLNIVPLTTEVHFTDEKWKIETVTRVLGLVETGKIKPFKSTVTQEIVDKRNESKNEFGQTQLHEVILDKNIEMEKKMKNVKELLLSGANVNTQDNNGQTPLHLAANTNHDIVKLLLEHHPNIHIQDNNGNNVLHIILSNMVWEYSLSSFEIIQTLIGKGININTKNKKGETPLWIAIEKDKGWGEDHINYKIITLLIASGGDVHLNTPQGESFIQYVAINKHYQIMKILVDFGADISGIDENGNTLLHLIAGRDKTKSVSEEMIGLFIGPRIDIDKKNNDGNTPLHTVLQIDNMWNRATIKFLIKNGANVNAADGRGLSPVFISIIKNGYGPYGDATRSLGELKLLVDAGANLYSFDKSGNLPIHVAMIEAYDRWKYKKEGWRGCVEIVNFLSQKGPGVDSLTQRGGKFDTLAIARMREQGLIK